MIGFCTAVIGNVAGHLGFFIFFKDFINAIAFVLLGTSVPGLKTSIRALSAHSAAEFNSSPGRWHHVWLVAIVPPERWGKMDRNDCHTAWGDFKTLISLLDHSKNYACSFSLIDFLFYFNVGFLSF
jgi:hypothetical protein